MGREKTALVLSAGGMFGAYQAGVWQELHDVLRPDIVVGASIGSLNGWMIAGGIGGNELVERWLTADQLLRHRWRVPGVFPVGMIDPAGTGTLIRAIHEEFTPAVDFGLVTTELPSLRPRLFRYPDVRCEHLASSCALPFVMPLGRIGRAAYWDGGLMLPLPLWAAIEMGATRIVAVNLLPARPALIEAFARGLRWYCRWNGAAAEVEVIEIVPSGRLGKMRHSVYWSRDNAERWIAQGRADAQRARSNISL